MWCIAKPISSYHLWKHRSALAQLQTGLCVSVLFSLLLCLVTVVSSTRAPRPIHYRPTKKPQMDDALPKCWYLLGVTALSCAVLHHLWFGYRRSTRFILNLHISHIVTLLLPQLDSPTPFVDGETVFCLMLNFCPHLWRPHSLSSACLDTNQNDDAVQGSLSPPAYTDLELESLKQLCESCLHHPPSNLMIVFGISWHK